ncbi:GntR family transcriptional regulator [Arthrobacter rhombi]
MDAVVFIVAFISYDGSMATNQQVSRFWSWRPDASPAKTAVERVYVGVSADIVGGSLTGGTLITEGEMAERFAVSRTPVREAFLVLEAQGLLVLFPKKGAIVTTPDAAENQQLRQVRIMLESRAVELQNGLSASDSPLSAQLTDLIETQRRAASTGDALAFARADHRFHACVVAASGNPIIDDFYAQLGPRLARLTCLTVQNAGELQRFVNEHTRLAELFRVADHHGYEELLQSHVSGA